MAYASKGVTVTDTAETERKSIIVESDCLWTKNATAKDEVLTIKPGKRIVLPYSV